MIKNSGSDRIKISFNKHVYKYKLLTRRGSEVWITDSAETLGLVLEYRNIKKAAILDPNAKKKIKFWPLLALFSRKS